MCALREKKLGVDAFPIQFKLGQGAILLPLFKVTDNVFVQIRSGIEGSLLISPMFCHPIFTENSHPWSKHGTNYKKTSPKKYLEIFFQDFLRLMQKCCDPVPGQSKLTISQQHEPPKFISHGSVIPFNSFICYNKIDFKNIAGNLKIVYNSFLQLRLTQKSNNSKILKPNEFS